MKLFKLLLTLTFIVFFYFPTTAQGCSDAGFCSVGNTFKNDQLEFKNNLEIGTVFGVGEEDVLLYSPYLTYTRNLSKNFALSAKVTGTLAEGSFGKIANVGDVFVTSNYKWKSGAYDTWKWSSLLGFKIPLTAGNDKINNFSLPMPYQASLGTFDGIAGIDLASKKWEFSTAIQIPFTNSKNSYFQELAPTDKFISTNLLERKSDILFRSAYKIRTANQKFLFKPNLLFIYHLGEDQFVNVFGLKQTIADSAGLTINGNFIGSYKIAKKAWLDASVATPFVVRKVRPDGLTRALTFGLSYKQNF